MLVTKLALACALLMTGQSSGDAVYTNLRIGRIGADINPDRAAEIKELQLFESPDHGRTWNQVDKITPDKDSFRYSVPGDGEYWYHVVVINHQGNQEPADLYKAAPKMKLVVDTKPPDLKITSAQRQGDDLVVSWAVHEDNPDPQKLKLDYRTADSGVWVPIAITPTPSGTAKAHLSTPAAVTVRLQFRDLANNASSVEAQVPGSVAAAGYSPPAPTPVAQDRPPLDLPQLPPAPEKAPMLIAPPQPTLPIQPQQITNGIPGVVSSSAVTQQQSPAAKMQPIASTSDSSQGSIVPQPAVQTRPTGMPPIQYVNDPEIVVEYEVSKVGPSGLGKVDVWLTRDFGATWVLYADDPNPSQAANGKNYQWTLNLQKEGVYGITLVVKSKAGLSKAAPRPGDAPEILVEVDTTPPEAQLLPLVADPKRHDTVVLSWTAKDRKLDTITLEWAEGPTGPWQTIAAGLPPTSTSYAWQPPTTLPPLVYLKLTVKDAAGNIAVATTHSPQAVDLNEPEGRLIRVMPANKK